MSDKMHYLEQGVLMMSHAQNDWFAGHYGAVLLATYYMIKENELPKHVEQGLLQNADAVIAKHPNLLVPYPPEEADPALLEQLMDGFRKNTTNLFASGHGLAMGVLSVKALVERPDLLTPSVVEGLLGMLEDTMDDKPHRYYSIADHYSVPLEAYADHVPEYRNVQDMIQQAFTEIQRVTPNVKIDGQVFHLTGEAEHGITHAHAIWELEQLGFHDIVERALANHRKQMYLNRFRPEWAWEKEIVEPPFQSLFAPEYWEKVYNDPHSVKVPYATLTLLKQLPAEQHPEAEKNVCKILCQMK